MATETAIFRKSYFERTPLTGCYSILLKRLESEPLVFENIANHSADFIKSAQSKRYFKCIINSNILWNLEFAIFAFIRYKTLVHGARFPYSSLMRTEQSQIYLLWFTSFTVLYKFYEKSTPQLFFLIIDTDHFTLSENNISLSQFLQIKE